jgi:flagellum-specific peptidoglycan hydrolase FlgJ
MKRFFKKGIPVLFAAGMILNTLPIKAYTDINYNDSNWYNGVILEATNNGWMTGYENGSFGPNDTMSRGMAATVLYRMANAGNTAFVAYYPDVQYAGDYYAIPVTWAKQNKVITGYENGYFGPNDCLTREQLAVILYRYAGTLGCDVSTRASLSSFSDNAQVSSYALTAMQWAVSVGILSGDAGRLKPTTAVNRAEACKMLVIANRFIQGNQNVDDSSSTIDTSLYSLTAKDLQGKTVYEVIDILAPLFQENAKSSGILASVSMAQFILESGYAQSELAQNANNLFGMKSYISNNTWANSTWDGVSVYNKVTQEADSNGNPTITITATFRAYDTMYQSISDHSAYLLGAMNGNTLRYDGIAGCKDYTKALQIIADGGYAGNSKTYVSSLTSVIERYNLTQYD